MLWRRGDGRKLAEVDLARQRQNIVETQAECMSRDIVESIPRCVGIPERLGGRGGSKGVWRGAKGRRSVEAGSDEKCERLGMGEST